LNGGDSDNDMCGYLANTDLNTVPGPVVHVLSVSVPAPVLLMLLVLLLLQSPRSSARLPGGDGGRCGCGLSYPQLAEPSG